MAISKELREEFIGKMASGIISELEEKAIKEGKNLSFDDIETGALLFRQRIGEEVAKKIVAEQGTGKLKKRNRLAVLLKARSRLKKC